MSTLTAEQLEEKELQLKWDYAEALLRNPNNPFQAALHVTFGNTIAALTLVDRWRRCPQLEMMKRSLVAEQGEDAFLPSEAEMLRDVLRRAHESYDNDQYVKLMALAFDVRGMTSKAKQGPSVVVNNVNNKTMNIPVMVNANGEKLSDDDWEKSLMLQQQRLVDGNA